MKADKSTRVQQSLPAVLGVLAASVLLGVAYNSASPLGVRSPSAAASLNQSNIGEGNQRPAVTNAVASTAPSAPVVQPTPAPAPAPAPVSVLPPPPPPVAPGASATAQPTTQPAPTPTPTPPPRPPILNVTWAEVKPLLAESKLVLIDARAASAYEAEHIPGAFSLPAGSPQNEVSAFVERHGKEKLYVIYCGSGQCGLSKTAANALINEGCTNVKVMPGGFSEYRLSEANPTSPP